ncbi:MAG: SEFIR domain-containing protein [Myxococcota bacterium]
MTSSTFISYSHDSKDHAQRVLALADQLRADGIDAQIDRYVQNPPEGWPRWRQQQLSQSRFVLLVCTKEYRQRFEDRASPPGAATSWDAHWAEQELFEQAGHNKRLIPVVLEDDGEQVIPRPLRRYTYYRLPQEYERLLRRLTGQHDTPAPPLGTPRELPPELPPEPPPERGHRAHNCEGSPDAGTAATPGMAPALDPRWQPLVDELARVFYDPDQARVFVTRCGMPPQFIPRFDTSGVFWQKIAIEAQGGKIPGGVPTLGRAAGRDYPGNAVFGQYR